MDKYIGYHGTDNEAAKKIYDKQYFKPSRNEDDWLGEGVYFFFDDKDAHWWCDCKKIKNYTILKAEVKADPEYIINLSHDSKYLEIFKIFCHQVKDRSLKKTDGLLRSNYMALALKLMKKKLRMDVIIAAFDQNRQMWLKGISRKNQDEFLTKFPIVVSQLQMCVVNRECINNIENCFSQEG